jgi:beta-xylosidase
LADPTRPGVIDQTGWDEPEPFVIVQGGSYYLFTSQSNEPQNVPVRSATAFGQWGARVDALPDPPAWATPGIMWAPDVAQFGSHYILYFTAQLASQAQHTMCIGDAISTNVAGPYIASPTPLICQISLGGSIDPRVFVDNNGQAYMVWKSDQDSRSLTIDTQIWSQLLSADGLHLLGSPTTIFAPDEPWQRTIVEAPQIELVKGNYYLFYSGGYFNHPDYAIGVARCAGPMGPCRDTTAAPLLGSNLQGWGPGEESIFANDAGIWMVYSPWFANPSNTGPPRPLALAHLGFGPNGPYLAAPLETGAPSAASAATRAP